MLQAQAFGLAIEWIRIEGNGPNALDFHIACHLGEGLARTPQAEFVIVSRDTGFDPLLRHLKARGLHWRRERGWGASMGARSQVKRSARQHQQSSVDRTVSGIAAQFSQPPSRSLQPVGL